MAAAGCPVSARTPELTETERAELQRLRDERHGWELGLGLLRMERSELEADIEEAVRLIDAHVPAEALDPNTRNLTARFRRRLARWHKGGAP